MSMTRRVVAFSGDHTIFPFRDEIVKIIRETDPNIDVLYLGPESAASVDYPDFAETLAKAVVEGKAQCGVLLCGTGIGVSIAANKVCGVRAAVCHDHLTAQLCRQHNDANVLCAGVRIVGMEEMRDIVQTFLTTPFAAGRHQGRVDKITAIEHKSKQAHE